MRGQTSVQRGAEARPVRIQSEAIGDGPTVLLTHGFGATSEMWRHQLGVLSKQHRVVTWDLRGHGRTRATTATIEDAGHLPNIEQPAAFNGHLLDFLTAL